MKIIANIGQFDSADRLVQISKRELEMLVDVQHCNFGVGDTINIAKTFNILDNLRNNRHILTKQSEQLRAIASLFDPMKDIISEILPQ